jgi:transcriptional regulator with XRE-family HTH domain
MRARIRELRKKKGISQTQLGHEIGFSPKSISMIESGQNKPTVQQIEELSKFFNVSADYLLFGIENTKDIEPIERDFLRIIRKNANVYEALAGMLKSNNYFEHLAA